MQAETELINIGTGLLDTQISKSYRVLHLKAIEVEYENKFWSFWMENCSFLILFAEWEAIPKDTSKAI